MHRQTCCEEHGRGAGDGMREGFSPSHDMWSNNRGALTRLQPLRQTTALVSWKKKNCLQEQSHNKKGFSSGYRLPPIKVRSQCLGKTTWGRQHSDAAASQVKIPKPHLFTQVRMAQAGLSLAETSPAAVCHLAQQTQLLCFGRKNSSNMGQRLTTPSLPPS